MAVVPNATHAQRRVGALLRKHRKAAGWTMLAVAVETGIHERRIARVEKGQLKPRRSELDLLLKVIGVDDAVRDDLLTIADDAISPPIQLWPSYPTDETSPMEEQQRNARLLLEAADEVTFFSTNIVFGPFQCLGYCEHVSRTFHGSKQPPADDGLTNWQLRQQQLAIILDKRSTRVLLKESALDAGIAPHDVMAQQAQILAQLGHRPDLQISVIPRHTLLPNKLQHDFVLFDNDLLLMDTGFGGIQITSQQSIEIAAAALEQLGAIALHGPEASAYLLDIAQRHLEQISFTC